MDLYKEILITALRTSQMEISFPTLDLTARFESTCYQTLLAIKSILQDDTLNDEACFEKIEAIVSVMNDVGIHTHRHDFG